MAEVVSTLSQLVNAFKTHIKISNASPEEYSHTLLLFYGVECGLKAKYLKMYNGLCTSDFEKLPTAKKYGYGHDLWQWAKVLKIPNTGFTDDKSRPISQMHERLRYGNYTKSSFENEQIKFLKDLMSILKKEL